MDLARVNRTPVTVAKFCLIATLALPNALMAAVGPASNLAEGSSSQGLTLHQICPDGSFILGISASGLRGISSSGLRDISP
jgi:hypothetical protein